MASGTILERLDLPIPDHFGAVQFLQPRSFIRVVVPFPVEISDLVRRPDFRRRITMAVQTKSHAERLIMINLFHLVDRTMAFNTTNATIDMDRMIEIDEVWNTMHLYPGNRHPSRSTVSNQCQARIVLEHLVVAIHASRTRGDV